MKIVLMLGAIIIFQKYSVFEVLGFKLFDFLRNQQNNIY